MTEKIESMEIHPMRGHSRGDWYCSLDDIASSEEEAEYWTVFGVTHRGNKHCLGEFQSKSAARSAVDGTRAPRQPNARLPSGRTIIHVEVFENTSDPTVFDLFALCDDGTKWRRANGVRKGSELLDDRWEQISINEFPDFPEDGEIGWTLAPKKQI